MHGQPKRYADLPTLERAGRTLLGSIVAGEAWSDALEPLMSGTCCLGGGLARVTPPSIAAVPTSGLFTVVDDIRKRRAPPISTLSRVDPTPHGGFVCDQMERFATARARDPFTQEFVRPHGLAYQASAFLDHTDLGQIDFLLFKGPGTGGFDTQDLNAFEVLLPYLRAATMSCRGSLQTDADRRAATYSRRGDPVLHLSHDGTVRDRSIEEVRSLAPDVGLTRRRITVRLPGDQRRLDHAIRTALDEGRPGLVTVAGSETGSLRLLVVPISGQALDMFLTTAALVVAVDIVRATRLDEDGFDLLASTVGLTRRERDVARLVAGGSNPRTSAGVLGMTYDTARLHLKAVYAKVGVHSQAELISLVSRLASR